MQQPAGYIYALRDPQTDVFRYVGQTIDPKTRGGHFRSRTARCKDTPLGRWLRRLHRKGHKPELVVLEEVDQQGQLTQKEQHWIEHYRSTALNLTRGRPHSDNKGCPRRRIIGIFRSDKVVAELLECGHCLRKLDRDHKPSKRGARACYRCRDAA